MRACGSSHTNDMIGIIGTCRIPVRSLKSSHLTTCFTVRSSPCLTHFHHFVPRHRSRHQTHCCWHESGEPPAPLHQQGCCSAIWPSHLLTQVMSPSPASAKAVSTRRSTTRRGKRTASTSRMTLPPPVAASEHTPTVFHQQAAASGSQQLTQARVVNPWHSRRHVVQH